jgi:hypothetical protein
MENRQRRHDLRIRSWWSLRQHCEPADSGNALGIGLRRILFYCPASENRTGQFNRVLVVNPGREGERFKKRFPEFWNRPGQRDRQFVATQELHYPAGGNVIGLYHVLHSAWKTVTALFLLETSALLFLRLRPSDGPPRIDPSKDTLGKVLRPCFRS